MNRAKHIAAALLALALLTGAGCLPLKGEAGAAPKVSAVYPVPLGRELQAEIAGICECYNVSPAVVLAVIGRESGYGAQAVGDGGAALGLMQVQPQYHGERMRRLGVTDLFDPAQNVTVGVDYLAELIAEYGDLHMALTAYNAGPTAAWEGWFSVGVYESDYSRAVLAQAQILTEGVITYVG